MAERFDLVLRGGRIVDPANEVDRVGDVGFRHGKVAAVRDVVEDWLEWGGPRHVGIDPSVLDEETAE